MSAERIAHSVLAREDLATREGWKPSEHEDPRLVTLATEYLNLLDQHEALVASSRARPGFDIVGARPHTGITSPPN